MKAPNFWHQSNLSSTFLTLLLRPISWFYFLAHAIKFSLQKPQKSPIPVICVGNAVAGGAGKTPIALALGKTLQESKVNFAYLSKGYGGKVKNFTEVKSDHSAQDVGDEPLLLSEISNTFISSNRFAATQQISAQFNKQLVILDDGWQDNSIVKDLGILVIEGAYGFGNGAMLPAGPMRESAKSAIQRADLVVIVGEDVFNIEQKFCQTTSQSQKVIKAKLEVVNAKKFQKAPLMAFCGIARPQKFFNSLKDSNLKVLKHFSYPDHHPFSDAQINKMLDFAQKNDASLIATKKDWMRLDENFRKKINYLDVKIVFEDEALVKAQLLKLINE